MTGDLRKMIADATIPIIEQDRYDAVRAADLVWTASGTATLETALLTRPMVDRLPRVLADLFHCAASWSGLSISVWSI